MIKLNLPFESSQGYAEAGAQEQEDRASGPGLRSAGSWIQGGTGGSGPFMEAAK